MSAEKRRLRLAERVKVDGRDVHPRAKHGTPSGYSYWGCRCAPCTSAINRHVRAWSDEQLDKAVMVDGRRYVAHAPHGTTSGYSSYRCQCDPCTDAWNDYMRQYMASYAA